MEENEVYVYLFTGFLESGKTSLIQGTIEEPDFMKGETGLLICCEEGEVEYDEALLKKVGIDMVVVEEQEFAESKATSDANAGSFSHAGGFQQAPAPTPAADAGDGFMNIPDGIDEELPFN